MLAAAEHIVEMYGKGDELYHAYLKQQKKEPSVQREKEFQQWLDVQKGVAEGYIPAQLRSALEDYMRNPGGDQFKIFVFRASQEFLTRPKEV